MIIYAVNVHSGGGKVLLDELLINQNFGNISNIFVDARYIIPPNIDPKIKITIVEPTLAKRVNAELLLRHLCKKSEEQILSFGNLPPIFRHPAKVCVYFQNANLLPTIPIPKDNYKLFLRSLIERLWIRIFIKNCDEIWVQSDWMKKNATAFNRPIKLMPFLPTFPPKGDSPTEKTYDAILVTSQESHKRLSEFLMTWKNRTDPKPKIAIVANSLSQAQRNLINEIVASGAVCDLHFNASREQVYKLYCMSKSLIVTSKWESFCLPIFEARHFGLKVFCIDSDFCSEVEDIEHLVDFNELLKLEFIPSGK